MTAAGGAGLNVEDVFSTYLFNFASAPYTVTNGIDLSGEGGLVWIKGRNSNNHWLHDSERTLSNALFSNLSDAEYSTSNSVTSLNNNGFTVGGIHSGSVDHASWTFRKAPKFFDVVTYTGNSTAGRTVSHNLGSVPGMIIVKRLDLTTHWAVYHRGMHPTSPEDYYMRLNDTLARQDSASWWNDTAPTSTEFTLGSSSTTNGTGSPFVAYLFAHNNSDGGFGPTGDQDIIKCGSFTTDGSGHFDVNLGFEAQWVLAKRADSTGSWTLWDNMRGFAQTSSNPLLANSSGAELNYTSGYGFATSTGFKGDANWFGTNASNVIYIAIRRGPMAVPESATDVFGMDFLGATSPNPPAYNSGGWPVDMGIQASVGAVNSNVISARLTQGKFLVTDGNDAETASNQWAFDFQDGWRDSTAVSNSYLGFMWRRAPNFFDVVAYSGNSTAGRTVSHNLGVAPEMMWVKKRNESDSWQVYVEPLGNTKYLTLNDSSAAGTATSRWNDTDPTETTFTLGTSGNVNESNATYIAYLFASLDGVSKVGSYTGNGGTSVTGTGQNIDCGFSNGARFVLIKPTNAADNWFLYDSERGIVAGNDATLQLNLTAAQSTSSDEIDPLNSGFTILNGNNQLNRTGREYIFYAIA